MQVAYGIIACDKTKRKGKGMQRIGNLTWLAIYGLLVAASHFIIGISLCLTIVFIPSGVQFIKIARYAIWPFGRYVVTDFDRRPICNLVWIAMFGWIFSLVHVVVGVALSISLVGIPLARKCFTLARLTFLPFGALVE